MFEDLKTNFLPDSVRDKPNSVTLLRTPDAQLSSFESFIPAGDLDAAMILSLGAAIECNRCLKERQRSRLDFGSSRSSGSSSDSSGQLGGGAYARQFADGVVAAQPILEVTLSHCSTVLEQVKCIKKALHSNRSLLVLCLTQGPTRSMGASVAALAKLCALKHPISKVVATELQVPNTCVALAAALSPAVLTGFLDGSRLPLQTCSPVTLHSSKCVLLAAVNLHLKICRRT